MKHALIGLAVFGALAFMGSYFIAPAVAPEDRSFYVMPDKNDWPGYMLSEAQYERAVAHFSAYDACRKPWRWTIIGPGDFLLEGTHYEVRNAYNAEIPNVTAVKGYWGSGVATDVLFRSVPAMKLIAQDDANKDCSYGIVP
jgi:hypothetical protein